MVTIPHLLITRPLPPLITHIQSIPHCISNSSFLGSIVFADELFFIIIDPFKALGMYKA